MSWSILFVSTTAILHRRAILTVCSSLQHVITRNLSIVCHLLPFKTCKLIIGIETTRVDVPTLFFSIPRCMYSILAGTSINYTLLILLLRCSDPIDSRLITSWGKNLDHWAVLLFALVVHPSYLQLNVPCIQPSALPPCNEPFSCDEEGKCPPLIGRSWAYLPCSFMPPYPSRFFIFLSHPLFVSILLCWWTVSHLRHHPKLTPVFRHTQLVSYIS